MTSTESHFDSFKEWVATIRQDVETLEAIVTGDTIDRSAREYAAAALNYLVTRMDLVPDWEDSVGVIDDVMVIRICVELASQHSVDEGLSEADHIVSVGRLVNESKQIEEFLGGELYADLRKHVSRLTEKVVRGRGVGTILDDSDARKKLFEEVEADIKAMPAATFTDVEALAVRFKSYLQHKLS